MNRAKYTLLMLGSYLLSFFTAFCLILGVVLAVVSVTLANHDYLVSCFTKDSVVSELTQNLDEKSEELSEKYNIPKDVFMDAIGYEEIKSVQGLIIEGTNSSNYIDFNNVLNIRQKCTASINDYCSENNIKLKKAEIEKITDDAISNFNEVCSIANNGEISSLFGIVNHNNFILAVGFIAVAFVCIFLLKRFNAGRHKYLNYVGMSFAIAGDLLIVFSAILLLTKAIYNLDITNISAYNSAITLSVKPLLYIFIAAGILFCIISTVLFVTVYDYYRVAIRESDTEREISKNII